MLELLVVNDGWLERFVRDTWKVKKDWGVSDHSCILIGVEGVRGKFKENLKNKRGWFMGNVKSELGMEVYMTSLENFARLPRREQLESLHGWICIATRRQKGL